MRRWMLLLWFLLLPVSGLAVSENVVEAAPDVRIEMGKQTDALFGLWEQGLADIRTAAAHAAALWKGEALALSLKEITLRNSPMDDDPGNDEITVTFTYTQDGAARRLHVHYLRGTGEVTGLSDVRDNSVAQSRTESPKGPLLADAQLEEMARGFLMSQYGETDPRLKELVDSANDDRWFARFDVERGMYEVVLDRRTGGVTRVSLDMAP